MEVVVTKGCDFHEFAMEGCHDCHDEVKQLEHERAEHKKH